MDICSNNHDEIVYDNSRYNSKCPLCAVFEELEDTKKEVAKLEKELEDIEEYECQVCHDVRKLKE